MFLSNLYTYTDIRDIIDHHVFSRTEKGVAAATLWPALMGMPSVPDVGTRRGRTCVLNHLPRTVSSACF